MSDIQSDVEPRRKRRIDSKKVKRGRVAVRANAISRCQE